MQSPKQTRNNSTSYSRRCGNAWPRLPRFFLTVQQGGDIFFHYILWDDASKLQAQGLLDAQGKTVIATLQDIFDDVASDLAVRFYTSLAGGADIRQSFNEATAAIRTEIGDDLLSYYHGVPEEKFLWPWELYLATDANTWNLPAAARDPLFGLPALPFGDLPAKPYRHLNWFTRKHAEVFFGRGRQIRNLYDLAATPNTAPFVLLYGQSGVGKSSLLEAGLLPCLESNYVVRY